MFPSRLGVHRVLISPYRLDTEVHEQDFWVFTTDHDTCKANANASHLLFDITLHSHSVQTLKGLKTQKSEQSERTPLSDRGLAHWAACYHRVRGKGSRFTSAVIHVHVCRPSSLHAICTSAELVLNRGIHTLKSAEAPLQAVFRLSVAAVLDMYHLALTSVGLLGKDFLEFSSTLRQALTALFHKSSESDTILEMGGRGERRENRRGVSKRENRFFLGGLLFAFYESADFSMD